MPSTVLDVEVLEGPATQLNFTLQSLDNHTIETVTPTMASSTEFKMHNVSEMEDVQQSNTIEPENFRHHNYIDMEILLRKYATEYPAITRSYSIGKSVEERNLYVMEISDNPGVHELGIIAAIVYNLFNVYLYFYGQNECTVPPIVLRARILLSH